MCEGIVGIADESAREVRVCLSRLRFPCIVRILQHAIDHSTGNIGESDSSAFEREYVVCEYGIALFCELMCPGSISVVVALVGGDRLMGLCFSSDDLALSEELVVPVIVQCENTGQRSTHMFRCEQVGFGWTAEW